MSEVLGSWRRVLSLVLLVMLAATTPALAGPTAEERGDLAKPLQKKISIELIGTPLPRALETIAKESGLNVLIAPVQAEALARESVTLSLKELPVDKALNLICMGTSCDWFIREGVVMVATEEYVIRLRAKTQIYNIRELIESVPNYLGKDLSIDGTLSNTSSGGSDARQSESYSKGGSGGGTSGGGLFGDDTGDDMPSREELVEQISELIQTTAGNPDRWLDEYFTINEFNGSLIVKATPEVHQQVNTLLTGLSDTSGQMVVVEGQFYVVPRSLVEGLDGNLVLKPDAYSSLADKLKVGVSTNVRRIAGARTVCFNSQRVYVYAAKEKAMISDLEPIPDAFSVDPTISTLHNGAVLDIKPTVTLDGKSISIAVRSDAVLGMKMSTGSVPVTTAAASSDKTAKKSDPKAVTRPGEVDLGLPELEIATYRTNVRIPDGGAVVLSGITSQFDKLDADNMELIFVMRARIVK